MRLTGLVAVGGLPTVYCCGVKLKGLLPGEGLASAM